MSLIRCGSGVGMAVAVRTSGSVGAAAAFAAGAATASAAASAAATASATTGGRPARGRGRAARGRGGRPARGRPRRRARLGRCGAAATAAAARLLAGLLLLPLRRGKRPGRLEGHDLGLRLVGLEGPDRRGRLLRLAAARRRLADPERSGEGHHDGGDRNADGLTGHRPSHVPTLRTLVEPGLTQPRLLAPAALFLMSQKKTWPIWSSNWETTTTVSRAPFGILRPRNTFFVA